MGDPENCPDSPQLSRGTYNFNFEEFDDTMDPFKPRGGLNNSPGKEISNPFQSKSKIASSPPKAAVPKHDLENDPVEAVETQKDESVDVAEEIPQESNHTRSKAINIKKPKKGKKKAVNKQQNELNNTPSGNVDIAEENPFQTKPKLGSSPKDEEDPFKSNSKLKNSPPQNDSDCLLEENPFQTKTKLGVSPPGAQDFIQVAANESDKTAEASEDMQSESVESFNTAEESPEKSNNKGLKTRSKSQTPPVTRPIENSVPEDVDQDGGSEPVKPKPEKKAASPKKSGIKKPKARSKFKPPANFGVQESEDVVIFAPPPPQSANDDTARGEAPAEIDNLNDKQPIGEDDSNTPTNQMAETDNLNDKQPIGEEDSNTPANQMTASEVLGRVSESEMIDSVHDFGACDMPVESNEDFVPASEAFDEDEAWDMMERMKHENGAPQIRDSLTPFDPLANQQVPDKVTRRSSDGEIDGNNHAEDNDLLLMNTPPPQKQHSGSSRGVARHPAARALQEHVEGDGAPREAHVVDKMLFSPARGEDGKPRVEGGERYFDAPEYPLHKSQNENEVERMNAANKKHGTTTDISKDNIVQLVQVLKYSQSDWNKMKQDLELDFNARILNKEREWSKKLADRDKKISYLEEQVLLLRSSNEDMKCVVAEFEKTIAQLQAEKVKSTTESQQGYEDLVKERDQALEDLQSVETAFSDLHQRYERTKGVVEGFKKNEDVLKKCVQDYQSKLKYAEDKTVAVRQQAEEKLALASEEMDKLRKTTTSEVARLEAAFKKAELKIQGLDRSLEQKMQENSELTAICDELIAKVSSD